MFVNYFAAFSFTSPLDLPMSWTSERVFALSPDSSSAKSGRDLASTRKWGLLAQNSDASVLWGECQGSGKLPYQTQIDLSSEVPSFKCSCPSRKFPCKHGLALLLLFAHDAATFTKSETPSWVSEWLEKRSKRVVKTEKAQDKEIDKDAQEKRLKARGKKVAAGLEDLSLWLRDLIRTGLANAPSKSYDFWETAAKRLIDAQAPGLARRVRELPHYLTGDNWSQCFLEQLALIHLLIEGYQSIESLSPETQADIRTAIGFTQSQDELNAQTPIEDIWRVYGQVTTEEDRLRARRTYLVGQQSQRVAMLLEFAHAQQPFNTLLSGFESWEGQVVFYPSNYPQRAILKEGRFISSNHSYQMRANGIAEILEHYSEALSKNPWTVRIPCTLEASPVPLDWTLRDLQGMQVKVHPQFAFWPLLLEDSAGKNLHFFGEWDGDCFLPLMSGNPETKQSLFYPFGGAQ